MGWIYFYGLHGYHSPLCIGVDGSSPGSGCGTSPELRDRCDSPTEARSEVARAVSASGPESAVKRARVAGTIGSHEGNRSSF